MHFRGYASPFLLLRQLWVLVKATFISVHAQPPSLQRESTINIVSESSIWIVFVTYEVYERDENIWYLRALFSCFFIHCVVLWSTRCRIFNCHLGGRYSFAVMRLLITEIRSQNITIDRLDVAQRYSVLSPHAHRCRCNNSLYYCRNENSRKRRVIKNWTNVYAKVSSTSEE